MIGDARYDDTVIEILLLKASVSAGVLLLVLPPDGSLLPVFPFAFGQIFSPEYRY